MKLLKMIAKPGKSLVAGACLLSVTTLFCAQAVAQSTIDPDWPCIQAFVPELNTAVYWPVPIEGDDLGSWNKDAGINDLARQLGALESFEDEHRQRVAEFAESRDEQMLQSQLNRLVDGIVSVASERRSLFLNGIKRYTRQQTDIARQIETRLNELSSLDATADAAAIAEAKETLFWQERIYDQREKSIVALCDRPVEVEETLSEVLREVAQYLP